MTRYPSRHMAGAALLLAGAALSHEAQAAAWTQPQGEGQVIVTGIATTSEKGFDDSGKTTPIAVYRKREVYTLIEYGVTDSLTVMATPSYSHVSVDDVPLGGNGIGYTEFGGRYRLASGHGGLLSVQATARVPGEKRYNQIAQLTAQGTEADLRALAGQSFSLGGLAAFADVETGYRWRRAGPANEFHLDATLGVRPAHRLLLLAQSYTVISDGAGSNGYPKSRYVNAGTSAVYDATHSLSLALGVTGTLAGRNALRERGMTAGVWFHF